MMKTSILTALLFVFLTSGTRSQNIHTLPGLPDSSEIIIIRNEYVLSFDVSNNIPKWVQWYLDSTWFGDVKRYKGQFKPDKGATHDDYNNSGYDRGHLCPSNERTRDPIMNKSTFLMSNVAPQTKALNQGVWRNLEMFYERIAREKSAYIIAGTISHSETWIKNKIRVPDSLYKIVIIFTKEIDSTSEVIAVKIPNINGIMKSDWKDFCVTIDALEISTGLDFLNKLPVELQEYLESRIY